MMDINQLESMTRDELIDMARDLGVTNCSTLKKKDCVMRLLQAHAEQQARGAMGDHLTRAIT